MSKAQPLTLDDLYKVLCQKGQLTDQPPDPTDEQKLSALEAYAHAQHWVIRVVMFYAFDDETPRPLYYFFQDHFQEEVNDDGAKLDAIRALASRTGKKLIETTKYAFDYDLDD
ncbi:MAG: hypothetical protein M1586_02855 [Patescibacteria group bacterium]|nr:hypothetical protein [Patescibacteria group bacterium]MCL5262203.1 hypothetical protein [Patescibacteria group bacterium]